MNISALFHRCLFGYCTVLTGHRVEIKFQTGKEITQAQLVYGDPYLWQKEAKGYAWKHQEKTMELIGETSLHKYWQIIIDVPTQRLKYYFRIFDEQKSICYGDRGVFSDATYNHWDGFFMPFVRESEALNPPSWASDVVWYQIFFDRFSDGDPTNNRIDGYNWDEPAHLNGYFGGDGQGILNHLEQLRDTGYTGIYLTPIFLAGSNHKYDTIDYYQIDPDFGNLDLFKKLVNKAHELGIKVMLDGVFNHTGIYFFAFLDIMKNGKDSRYAHWYHFTNFEPLEYLTFSTTKSMPKLNTDHPDVQDYFIDVMHYWIKETNIDAWRIDVANEVAHKFYKRAYQSIKKSNPDFYLVAEIWHDPINWLHQEFDAAMNYQLGFFIKDLINTHDIQQFLDQFYLYQFKYPTKIRQSTFTMLDSHDTHRLRFLLNDSEEKTLLALALLSVQQGGICQLYGTEYGLLGEDSEYDRALYPQRPTKEQKQFRQKVKKLLDIRNDHIDLITHGEVFIKQHQGLFYFIISDQKQQLTLIANISLQAQLADINAHDLFRETKLTQVNLKPYEFYLTYIK